jgi:uncharacterized protein with FMN-binding domain
VADGIYTGAYSRTLGSAKVRVTVRDGKVVSIEMLDRFSSPYGHKAFQHVPGRIVTNQTLDVDAETGATYSSANIVRAVSNALMTAPQP